MKKYNKRIVLNAFCRFWGKSVRVYEIFNYSNEDNKAVEVLSWRRGKKWMLKNKFNVLSAAKLIIVGLPIGQVSVGKLQAKEKQ